MERPYVPPPEARGAGDCEAWRPGALGQPTNTVTSGAFLVGAAWLLARRRRVEPEHRWRPAVAAAVSVATGIGSILYHGRGGRLGQLLHDGSLLAMVAWLPVGTRITAPAARMPAATRRRRAAAALGTGAGVAYALGRTGCPTCRPTSWWQWHGVWHVAMAAATTAWADATHVVPYLRDDADDGASR